MPGAIRLRFINRCEDGSRIIKGGQQGLYNIWPKLRHVTKSDQKTITIGTGIDAAGDGRSQTLSKALIVNGLSGRDCFRDQVSVSPCNDDHGQPARKQSSYNCPDDGSLSPGLQQFVRPTKPPREACGGYDYANAHGGP